MRKIRFLVAMLAAKWSAVLLKLLGRNASFLPGKIALKLCPDFLGRLTMPETVIAVTGTNGKTTVSNLITSLLRDCGYRVTNNSFGSNVQSGIAAALLSDATLSGRVKTDLAVLEVDERSSLLVYPYIKPDFLICNNLMRDSIKRNAHTEFIQYIINRALPESTELILNGDDLICSALGKPDQKRTFFGVDAEQPEHDDVPFVRDIVYCPRCGAKLEAQYVRYNHIGRFRCTACDLKSPDPDFVVSSIDREAQTFTVQHGDTQQAYHLLNDNIVNIYNFCGVIALLTRLGLTQEQLTEGFSRIRIVQSRYDCIHAGDLRITMQSAKGQNPIACARSFHYVAQCPGQSKALFLLIDDHGDSIRNSESTCWLYDCDYSYLADPSIRQIVFSGPRCKDQRLRALMAGVDDSKIVLWPDFHGRASLLDTQNCKDIYILFDVYLQNEAQKVRDDLIAQAKEASHHGD